MPLNFAFDAVSENGSYDNIAKLLQPRTGRITFTLPGHAQDLPDHFQVSHVMAGSLWKKLEALEKGDKLGNLGLDAGGSDFARSFAISTGSMFQGGRLEPHPHVVVDGGL